MKTEQLKKLIDHPVRWLDGSGPFSQIVLSTRIRLARNLDGIPFPHHATKLQSRQVLNFIKEVVENNRILKNMFFVDMDELSNTEKEFLLERHLTSPEHARKGRISKYLFFDSDETTAIMINEEDHIRLQVVVSGLQLFEAWKTIDEIDNSLGENLDYAYSDELGYLSSCPSNAGTGMRASVFMHLPGLVKTRRISQVLSDASKTGVVARGYYGEGTKSQAGFFQISNQVSLGLKEEEFVENIDTICREIITKEEDARNELFKKDSVKIKEEISLSYDMIRNQNIISSGQAMNMLSDLRLGLWYGLIPSLNLAFLNELLLLMNPAHIQMKEGKRLDAFNRDMKRALFFREKLRVKRRGSSLNGARKKS